MLPKTWQSTEDANLLSKVIGPRESIQRGTSAQ